MALLAEGERLVGWLPLSKEMRHTLVAEWGRMLSRAETGAGQPDDEELEEA